jgi:hypothetical protein
MLTVNNSQEADIFRPVCGLSSLCQLQNYNVMKFNVGDLWHIDDAWIVFASLFWSELGDARFTKHFATYIKRGCSHRKERIVWLTLSTGDPKLFQKLVKMAFELQDFRYESSICIELDTATVKEGHWFHSASTNCDRRKSDTLVIGPKLRVLINTKAYCA